MTHAWGPGHRPKIGWRGVIWTISGLLFVVVGILVFFPNALLNQKVAASLTEYLVHQLGPEAICGQVEVGWRSVTLEDVLLPLDENGSHVSIQRIEATFDPLVALAQPGAFERIIRSVNVVRPEFVLQTETKSSRQDSGDIIPKSVYSLLAKVDSLRSFTFEGGKFSLMGRDSLQTLLRDARGALTQPEVGRFQIDAHGRGEFPVGFDVRLHGTIVPNEESIEATVKVEVSEGELEIGGLPFELLSSNGGEIHARFLQLSGNATLSGDAEIMDIEARHSGNSFFVPHAKLTFADGVFRTNDLAIHGPGFQGVMSGDLVLLDSMRVNCRIEMALDAKQIAGILGEDVSGKASAFVSVTGPIHSPIIFATLQSDSLVWKQQVIRSFWADLEYRSDSLLVHNLGFESNPATLRAEGGIWFAGSPVLDLAVTLNPREVPDLMGSPCGLNELNLAVNGELRTPIVTWVARDSTGDALGSGSLHIRGQSVSLFFAESNGRAGTADVTLDSTQVSATISNAHVLVPIIYPRLDSLLRQIEQIEIAFQGNQDSGNLVIEVQGDTTVRATLSSVLSSLKFDGSYDRRGEQTFDLNGEWQGMTRRQDNFFGRGSVSIHDKVIDITNVYIDEAGELSGQIALDPPAVDLQLSIDELPLDRMPLIADFADKWKLAGILSGEVTAQGPIDSLGWYADLSFIDGIAQGLPGYWALATADGLNDGIDTVHVSFGRGVRSIFEAEGRLSISDNSIDVRADFPMSEASDFLQALTGRGGLLTGELEGDLLVTGKLSAPDVLASLRVSQGELFSELTVDRFAVDATLTTEADGTRLLAIPQLSFYKENKYRFYAELATVPVKGGSFHAMLEGSGDFLDLLQQVDADFTSQGSASELRMDFGGTWNSPEFTSGKLAVSQGVFTYPPAAPGLLDMNVLIQLNHSGVVDTGFIQVNEGKDELRLDFLPRSVDEAATLSPLVIPSPRIELGVLRISSSADGVLVRLPGFMKPEWLGRLSTGTDTLDAITISAFDSTRLAIQGDALMRDARFTFPFFSYGGGRMRPVTKWLVDRLYEAQWDLDISVGKGTHYDVEITGFKDSDLFTMLGKNPLLGTVAEYVDHISVDAIVAPTETPLLMAGSVMDSSLRLEGRLEATSGSADYLDQTFWIEELRADFDETDIFPVISGRGATYGVDSVGRTVPVYLTIYEIDEETQTRVPFGRFEDVTYVLEADGYPDPESVIALLGYDVTNFSQGKAEQLLTRTAMTAAKRIWLDPIARRLERATFFDQISLAPGGGASASLFRAQRENVLTDTLKSEGFVRLLKGSHVTVGKYLSSDVFVTYTGELAEASGEVEGGRLGLIHFWNLQYRVVPLSPDFVLDFAVEYDEASRRRDQSVALKYSFVLEP